MALTSILAGLTLGGVAKAMAVGAALGAVTNGGMTAIRGGSVGDIFKSAGIGAAVGGAGGAVAAPVGTAVSNIANGALSTANAATQTAVGSAVNSAVNGTANAATQTAVGSAVNSAVNSAGTTIASQSTNAVTEALTAGTTSSIESLPASITGTMTTGTTGGIFSSATNAPVSAGVTGASKAGAGVMTGGAAKVSAENAAIAQGANVAQQAGAGYVGTLPDLNTAGQALAAKAGATEVTSAAVHSGSASGVAAEAAGKVAGDTTLVTKAGLLNKAKDGAATLLGKAKTGTTTALNNVKSTVNDPNTAMENGAKSLIKGKNEVASFIKDNKASLIGQIPGTLLSIASTKAAREGSDAALDMQRQSLDWQKYTYQQALDEQEKTKASLKLNAEQSRNEKNLFASTLYGSDASNQIFSDGNAGNYSLLNIGAYTRNSRT